MLNLLTHTSQLITSLYYTLFHVIPHHSPRMNIDACVNKPATEWGPRMGEKAVCGANLMNTMPKPETEFKSLVRLYCEDMASRRKYIKRCKKKPEVKRQIVFDPLCLLQEQEGICRQEEEKKRIETLRHLEKLQNKERDDNRIKQEKEGRFQAILQLHKDNLQKKSCKPWNNIFKEPKIVSSMFLFIFSIFFWYFYRFVNTYQIYVSKSYQSFRCSYFEFTPTSLLQ